MVGDVIRDSQGYRYFEMPHHPLQKKKKKGVTLLATVLGRLFSCIRHVTLFIRYNGNHRHVIMALLKPCLTVLHHVISTRHLE